MCPNATSSDSVWTVPEMVNIMAGRGTSLGAFPDEMKQRNYYALQCVDSAYRITRPDPKNGCVASHAYNLYPIAVVAVALPVFVAMDVALRVVGPAIGDVLGPHIRIPVIAAFFSRDYLSSYAVVEVVIASFLAALATVFVFLTCREYLELTPSLLLALLYAYATPAWSTASRALWQHGPEMLLLAIALYFLARRRAHVSLLAWTAVPLCLAFFVRPTAAVVIVATGAFILYEYRGQFLRWCALGLATATPFFIYNFAIYHRLLQPYFTGQTFLPFAAASLPHFAGALAGQLVSPSRGLLVFSPFLIFSFAGIWFAFHRGWEKPLVAALTAAIAAHWMVISWYADWTAGFCFGPRYFSDIIPLFLFLLIPAVLEFERRGRPKTVLAAFAICAAMAFCIHLRGAVSWSVEEWNQPAVNPARVWDWRDPQFLRGL